MSNIKDHGPFYHGTKANLQVGDLLTAGFNSNYKPEVVMNHIYFTALPNGAGLAAELARSEGEPRVYIVEPTRSYRSTEPLRIVGEVLDWVRQTPEELQLLKEKLGKIKGDIIN